MPFDYSVGALFPKDGPATLFAVVGCLEYTYADNRHGQTGFRMTIGRAVDNQVAGIPFVEASPEPYGEPIPESMFAAGYPRTPPNVAHIDPKTLNFSPEDTGNYAQ
jgi:hypothetical protein